jgi:GR25 family glycosyltransferase involved in LPS biosynthesis
MNRFFSKIYIINLEDKEKRFKKVTKQFDRNNIKFKRFIAVDGRCKKKRECGSLRTKLAKDHKVHISNRLDPAAASLVVGTVEILREMIRKKYKRILICEDDIVFGRNMEKKFKEGISELKDEIPDWDVLYLGSGGVSGVKGISEKKTSHNKYKTSLSIVDKKEYNWYVHHKDDLRIPDYDDECEVISDHLTIPKRVGGSWCYAFSLKGAKKIIKRLEKINNHVDQIIPDMSERGELNTVAFDPPIVWHEEGAIRPDSDIKWEW